MKEFQDQAYKEFVKQKNDILHYIRLNDLIPIQSINKYNCALIMYKESLHEIKE